MASDGELTDGERAVVEAHVGWAEFVAEPVARHHPSLVDDIRAAARLALCRAIVARRRAPHVEFRSFAFRWVRGAALQVPHRWRPKGARSHTATIPTPSASSFGLLYSVLDAAPLVGEAFERSEEIDALLRRLPPRQAATLRAYYLDPATAGDIRGVAAALGCSVATTYRLHADAIRSLGGSRPTRVASRRVG